MDEAYEIIANSVMRTWWKNPWRWAVWTWIGVIFFSSTSLASTESEQAFRFIAERFLPYLRPETSPYGIIHLLADKSVHICLFAVLGMLLWKALSNERKKIALILLRGAVVGSCSEVLQIFFPGRDPAVTDVLINICGTALGIAIMLANERLRMRTAAASEACRNRFR